MNQEFKEYTRIVAELRDDATRVGYRVGEDTERNMRAAANIIEELSTSFSNADSRIESGKERETILREFIRDKCGDDGRQLLLRTVDPERYKGTSVDWILGSVPLELVPITKACGKDDCRYSFARCGRVCFECSTTMHDFGD